MTTSLFESAALAAGLTQIVAATKVAARLDVIVSESRFYIRFMRNAYHTLPEAYYQVCYFFIVVSFELPGAPAPYLLFA